jgi:hypothetical protein
VVELKGLYPSSNINNLGCQTAFRRPIDPQQYFWRLANWGGWFQSGSAAAAAVRS